MIRRASFLLTTLLAAAPWAFPQTISNLSPASAVAGSGPVTLTINGQFAQIPQPRVYFNVLNADQVIQLSVTAFNGASQITATIPASLLTTPESASISVVQGTGISNYVSFTVTAPPPTLLSVSPSSAPAGSPALTLTVYGANFPAPTSANAGVTITWNGTALQTTYVNSGQVTAIVSSKLLASPGIASISYLGSPALVSIAFTVTAPALLLSSISPTTVTAGSPGFTLTVNGSGFSSGTAVTWNGSSLTTTFVSATQLTAAVPASLITTAGTVSVGVAASGQTSPAPLSVTITPNLAITSLSPSSAAAGGPAFTLTINGSGFNSSSTAYWNSTALSESVVNAGQITAAVPAALIAQQGTASITVRFGNLVSNALTFTITATPLTLTSISPSTAVAGGPAFTLTANGAGFSSGAVITWNGSPLTTTFVSSGQLTAAVPASLIATAATASVGVAASGQTSSSPLAFVITPNLSITSISPSSALAGGPAFTLTVNGTGFNSSTSVLWNSTALAITSVNAGQITATVPALLIAQPGTASITALSGNVVSNAATFTITAVALTLTSISPNTALAGGAAFTLTANGTGFSNGSLVTWNGVTLSTSFVSATQLAATVPANLIATAGTVSVGVSVPGQVSPAPLSFVITPGLTLTSLSPSSTAAGGPAFTLTVNGAGFVSGTNIYWNGSLLSTTVVNGTQMTATVPANLIAQQGSASITAQNGNLVSNALTFSITSPLTLTLTSLSPSSAPAGSPGFTITVNGSGFVYGAATSSTVVGTVVTWNGSPLATTFVSTTQLTAAVPANLLTTAGTAAVSVTGSPQPPSLPFTILNPLTLTSISPSTVVAGGQAFTLTATGTGFLSTTSVTWNGTPLTTTFVSSTQLTASVPATLIAAAGTVNIDVSAATGQTTPPALQLVITPGLSLTSLSPSSAAAGGPAFTLTVNGSGFASGATVLWNTTALTTTFVSPTQLTAAVSASLIAQAGSASVTASVGTAVSNALPFTITAAAPVITSISPSTVASGSAAFTLTVNGTGFSSGATVSLNGTALTTTFVSVTQLAATVPANLIAKGGVVPVTAANAGGAASNAVNLTITVPTPAITSISPSTVPPGGPFFTLTVTGTGFVSGATVSLNSTALTTTFVSATQLTAIVPASLVAQPGTVQITVANAGGAASSAVSLTILAPVPTITSISPSTVVAGGPAFTLTVNGTNFASGATVLLGTASLTTTFVSSTQLTAAVPASLIQQAGMSPVTVTNPGSGASNPLPLAITVPVPTITGISPSSITAGGPAFTLTVNGTGFLSGVNVSVNGVVVPSTFVSATQVTALVPPNQIVQPGTAQVTVANPGGTPSNAVTLTITPAPAPTLTSISPTSANVGDPAFTLTLTGTGFVQGSSVQWNGAPLSTNLVSGTQLTATVDAGRLTQPGTVNVTVVNQVPNGPPLVSNALPFAINPVTPVVTSLSPNSATAGGPAFSLIVNGTGFLVLTTIQWNTTALTTHFVSATTVSADVPATLIAQAGTVTVTAVNPGNVVSAASTFTINPPAPPVITTLSPTSATAGGAAFTLTVTGTGFTSAPVVNFGTTALTTTFVSATQLTAAVPANLLLVPGTYPVQVQQGGTSSIPVNFTVSLPPPPALRLNPPATSGPAQQPTIDFGLNAGYPLALSGTVTLTFVSNATVPIVDPAIQFASGGTTFTFTVPPNTTTLPPLQIQTGTVAGVITLTVTLTAGGVDVTPATGSTATITIPKSAPVIRTVTLIRANGYLEVDINGYSTTRDMTTAVFQLNAAPGGSFTSSVFTVPVSSLFTAWYQSAASTAFGSQFTYAQPFTVIGNTSEIVSVTVTLTNSAGTVSATSN